MFQSDSKAELNLGAVILLTATLFLGISIGVLAVHTSGILSGGPDATSAISVQDDGSEFTVAVYDMGEYSKIQIEYNKNTEYVEREGEVSFEKTTTPSKLVVKGHYLETDKVVEIRSEEI